METHCRGKSRPYPFSISAILGDSAVSRKDEDFPIQQFTGEKRPTAKYMENAVKIEWKKEIAPSAKTKDNICKAPSYSWLHCSRYNPPKVHRNKRRRGAISNPSRQPRIPFTQIQQETLETNYQLNRYLSSDVAKELANILCLPEQRIKIWFQNRRARERREHTREKLL